MARKIYVYTLIFAAFFFCTKAFANSIDDIVNNNLQGAVVGISIKDAATGEVIYQKNPKTLVHPASTLKLVTGSAALDYLGSEYKFKTAIYKSGAKIYLKVGADPLFSHDDMLNLVSQYKNKNSETIKKLIIDDTIIDKIPFGTGWQWDDNASVYFPQMSPYIVNHNLFTIKAKCMGRIVELQRSDEYSEPFINKLKCGETNNITVERDIFSANPALILRGTVRDNEIVYIPALSPEILYKNVLAYAFLLNNTTINTVFGYEKPPVFASQEGVIEHDIKDVLKNILTYSDNLAAEILVKHLAAIKTESTGTTANGLLAVKDFYNSNGISTAEIIMADASGASMNDYVSADFMTNALILFKKNSNFNIIKNAMTDPSEGTFKGRVPELNGKIKVKTGSLANTSAIVGYLKTNSGRDVAFSIMLDNIPKRIKPKNIEDNIIRAISKF